MRWISSEHTSARLLFVVNVARVWFGFIDRENLKLDAPHAIDLQLRT